MTFAQWQRNAALRLHNAGFETREAAVTARLLLDFWAQQKSAALLYPDKIVEDETGLETLLNRLEAREPLPHILGSALFFGLEFKVSNAVLIPRPETELLVQTTLDALQNVQNPTVCDLGTGSGAVAISIAKTRPDARVCALELSAEAREIATHNALQNEVQIQFLEGQNDWFSPLQSLDKFDALVSNPPYIPASEIEELQPEVRDHEPRLALDGGSDGLEPYRIFAARGRDFLKNEGFFALELGAGQFEDVSILFEKNGWKVAPPIFDFAGIARVLVARTG